MIGEAQKPRLTVEESAVALTFDDGPDATWTPRVLDALAAAGATATFFVTPRLDLDVVAAVAAAGHEIGYHCGRHVRHTDREPAKVRAETVRDLESLAGIGIRPRAWRPPWGALADWTGVLAGELGLELWLWSHDTRDWSGIPATVMLAELDARLRPGTVILMHDGIGPGATRAGSAETVALVEPLAALIRGAGMRPGSISAATPIAAEVPA